MRQPSRARREEAPVAGEPGRDLAALSRKGACRAGADDIAVALRRRSRRRGRIAREHRELRQRVENLQRLIMRDMLLRLRRVDIGQSRDAVVCVMARSLDVESSPRAGSRVRRARRSERSASREARLRRAEIGDLVARRIEDGRRRRRRALRRPPPAEQCRSHRLRSLRRAESRPPPMRRRRGARAA